VAVRITPGIRVAVEVRDDVAELGTLVLVAVAVGVRLATVAVVVGDVEVVVEFVVEAAMTDSELVAVSMTGVLLGAMVGVGSELKVSWASTAAVA